MEEPILGRLLAGRNESSVLEKEAALDRMLDLVDPPQNNNLRWLSAAVPALAVAASIAFLMKAEAPLMPTAPGTEREFVSRGSLTSSISFRCLTADEQAPSECVPGALLAFGPTLAPGKPYFAAFAVRDDGSLIWYFPAAGEVSITLKPAADGVAVVPRAVPLGSEHPTGQYEVYGVFMERPLTREDIQQALGEDLSGRDGLELVHRTLEMKPDMNADMKLPAQQNLLRPKATPPSGEQQ